MSTGPSFFPTPALDHSFAGITAGTVAVCCVHPLDLLKIKFQVSTSPPPGNSNPLKQIYNSLTGIKRDSGWKGLYRGIGSNVAGNAAGWGLYFWLYTIIKGRLATDGSEKLTSGDYLLASAEASAITAVLTNPLWVVKVRMFTTRADAPDAYRSVAHGLTSIVRTEGVRGLYRGTSLGLFGVSSGALQFMAYEQMKNFAFYRKRRRIEKQGGMWREGEEKLSNATYTFVSAAAKLLALASTYPYQVIRSRLQNNATNHLYPNLRTCTRKTWQDEGYRGFYRGLGTNLIRVLPGTCVTFVVYENVAWLLRTTAIRRQREK
ncbi:mitochondrial FAD carrier protein [Cantharellus anzutake]|uniref:mitochondrial FAD carrier protein n=1 Tax=Cantharellus anzutake TaxID=1750568 RepID=UPI0019032A85|nr:mitochondrial FAD carrier protein [Cantharellus anzutake]KAF8316025.1 mitochondrial FAD carrier protein [Cantharellus anzutake]